MIDSEIVFEVVREGQRPRRFRFEQDEVRIGFSARCDLRLEPADMNGAEVNLVTKQGQPPLLRDTSKEGNFEFNGHPFVSETSVKPGDVISGYSYRITILEVPIPPLPPAPMAAERLAKEDLPTKAFTPAGDGEEKFFEEPALAPAPPPPAHQQPSAPREKLADIPVSAPEERKEIKEVSQPKKADLSYLYLFFAPVEKFLQQDEVSEILINGPRQIYIERKGKLQLVSDSEACRFPSERALQAAVMNVARTMGRFFDKDNPRLDARLPDGSRVHAVMPPLCRAGTVVAIRKFRKEKLTISQLVEFGSLSEEGSRLLDIIVKLGRNLIVAGATSSGKTSVLNVLSTLIPVDERILVLEDASELQLQQPHTVCFETRKADEYGKGEVTIRDLVHSALRLRPDRLVVGEIRSGEALDLLQAMNTGHDGSMSTIHANSPRDSLSRLETCSLFSGVDIPLSALREQVASAIHVVIQTARLHDGSRKITRVTEVLGLQDRDYVCKDIYVFEQEESSDKEKILGRHIFTGYQPTFLRAAQQHGFDLKGLFST